MVIKHTNKRTTNVIISCIGVNIRLHAHCNLSRFTADVCVGAVNLAWWSSATCSNNCSEWGKRWHRRLVPRRSLTTLIDLRVTWLVAYGATFVMRCACPPTGWCGANSWPSWWTLYGSAALAVCHQSILVSGRAVIDERQSDKQLSEGQ